jgi:hypothetical protein
LMVRERAAPVHRFKATAGSTPIGTCAIAGAPMSTSVSATLQDHEKADCLSRSATVSAASVRPVAPMRFAAFARRSPGAGDKMRTAVALLQTARCSASPA